MQELQSSRPLEYENITVLYSARARYTLGLASTCYQ